MRDRAMQALHLLALDPIAETTADPNSYGFRKERSTADAIEQCHERICLGVCDDRRAVGEPHFFHQTAIGLRKPHHARGVRGVAVPRRS